MVESISTFNLMKLLSKMDYALIITNFNLEIQDYNNIANLIFPNIQQHLHVSSIMSDWNAIQNIFTNKDWGDKIILEHDNIEKIYILEITILNPSENVIFLLLRDISDIILLEQERDRNKRVLEILKASTQAFVEESDELKLFERICKIITTTGDYLLAWIGMKSYGPEFLVVPVAFAGISSDYVKQIIVKWDDSNYGQGPTGRAIVEGETSYTKRIATAKKYWPWRKKAIAMHLQSSIAIPIQIDNSVIGALNIYSDHPVAFGKKEVSLLEQLTASLSHEISYIRNIAKIKRIENFLTIVEERYRAVVNQAPLGIILVKGSIIQFVNPKLLQLYQYVDINELVGKKVQILQPDKLKDKLFAKGNLREQEVIDEVRQSSIGKRKDGSQFPIEVVTSILNIDNESYSLAFISDISEHKKLENRLIVQERQLLHSQKMDIIGRLSGTIAHDFNNILTGIIGYSELIMSSAQFDEFTIMEIKELAIRASSLTKQLVKISKEDLSKVEVVELDVIIYDMLDFLDRITGNLITIKSNLDKGLFTKIDIHKFEQCVLNLVLNAKEAMNDVGTITISSKLTQFNQPKSTIFQNIPPGMYCEVSIEDQGCGISDDLTGIIFEPYFSTKNNSGLGLSIVLGIVKQFSGYIDLETRVGKGTTFKLLFPFVDLLIKENRSMMRKTSPMQQINNLHVIVVDDQQFILKIIQDILAQYCSKLEIFNNPQDAIEKIVAYYEKQVHIDLIITDIIMTEISGISLAKKIRVLLPEIPILFMSGYMKKCDLENLLEDGNSGFILKPFDFGSLTLAIKQLLKISD